MDERIIDIPSPDGRLAAVLHAPSSRSCAPGGRAALREPGGTVPRAVLMPPAGVRDRCGPMRLYTRLARRLAREGHVVLRYDGAGLGESDGVCPFTTKIAAYAAIQRGARSGEVLSAARFLSEHAGQPVVVLGLCGAVYQGAHLARLAPELVAGLFGIGAPVLSMGIPAPQPTGRAADHAQGDHAHEDRANAQERPTGFAPAEASRSWLRRSALRYLRRALDPSAWRRFFSGETDYAALGRSLSALAPRWPPGLVSARVEQFRGWPAGARGGARGDGAIVARAMRALALTDARVDRDTWAALLGLRGRGRPVHLVWGELDPSLHAFNDFVRARVPDVTALFQRHVIPAAAHECASAPAFEQLARLAAAFLRELDGARPADVRGA